MTNAALRGKPDAGSLLTRRRAKRSLNIRLNRSLSVSCPKSPRCLSRNTCRRSPSFITPNSHCFGSETQEHVERRACIDKDNIRKLVMPAMGLPDISDDAFNTCWNWSVGLVKAAIVLHEGDVLSLADLIRKDRTMDRERMDLAFGGVAQKIEQSADFQNDGIVKLARKQYDVMFRQQNQWLENLQ